MVVNGSWGWLVLPLGDPFHCYWFTTFQFYVIWFLSPFLVLWPLLCLRLSLFRLLFGAGISFSRPFFVQGPLLRRSSYQYNLTDFSFLNHSSIHFLILGNFCLGLGENFCYSTVVHCIFTSFRSDYQLAHLPFGYVEVLLSLVNLQADYGDLFPTFLVSVCWTIWRLWTWSFILLHRRFWSPVQQI